MFSNKLRSFAIFILCLNFLVNANNPQSITGITPGNGVKTIDEKLEIEVTGVKSDFMVFHVKKKMKFLILNEQGLNNYSQFVLPEPFDPTYIAHFPEQKKFTCAYLNMKFHYFRASIKDSSGSVKDAMVNQTNETVEMYRIESGLYADFERKHYSIENLKVGDEVSIEYYYSIPYSGNSFQLSSLRLFLNSEVFKENYELKIIFQSELRVSFSYYNDAVPDSTLELNNITTKIWNKKNLYGSLNEQGGRPYISLPYIVFSVQPFDLLYRVYNSFEEKFIPFYAFYSSIREMGQRSVMSTYHQGVKDKQSLLLDKFVRNETDSIINDTLGYKKLMQLQNVVVENFKYLDDVSYFKKLDILNPRLGEFTMKNELREIGRYNLYSSVILRLHLNYFTAYSADIRSGEVSNEYFFPMYNNDYFMAVLLKNNTTQFIYPKSSQFGYYLNEMPFYFEGTKARMVYLYDYNVYKKPIYDTLRQVVLPSSNVNDNFRKTNVLTTVNTETSALSFDARIVLSGQYSTMTRGLYQYDFTDKTINSLYNKKVYEINDNVKLISKQVSVTNKEFPFTTSVQAKYEAHELIGKQNDTMFINLTNWFNHIIYSDFETEDRQLDFYPDFCGKDTYMYMIQFDKNIKLVGSTEPVEISNAFGKYSFIVEQISQNTVKITSNFIVLNNIVPVENIDSVKDIYSIIQKSNNDKLFFVIDNQ